jgi:co-chaperonin GroES (HSP10)
MKGKILKGRLLIKERVLKEENKGGIIIPVADQKQRIGEVLIGGEQVIKGDVIYYASAKGVNITIDEEKFILLGESEVLYVE